MIHKTGGKVGKKLKIFAGFAIFALLMLCLILLFAAAYRQNKRAHLYDEEPDSDQVKISAVIVSDKDSPIIAP